MRTKFFLKWQPLNLKYAFMNGEKTIILLILLLAFVFAQKLNFLVGDYYPTRDSLHYHFNAFRYMNESIWVHKALPHIFPANGGVPFALSSMSFGLLMPYKLFGSLVHPLGATTSWKVSLAFGWLTFFAAFFLCLRHHSKSAIASFIVCIILAKAGFSNGYHQEQILYTVYFMPFLYLLIRKMVKQPTPFKSLLIGLFFGLMSFTHFPQIQVFVIILVWLTLREEIAQLFKKTCNNTLITYFLFFLMSFSVASLPTMNFLVHYQDLILPQRMFENFSNFFNSLDEIFRTTKVLGVDGLYFCTTPDLDCALSSLFWPNTYITDDQSSLYLGPDFALLLLAACFFAFFKKKSGTTAIGLFAVLVFALFLGPNIAVSGNFARLLQLPFGEFRQWYHFFPLVILSSAFFISKNLSNIAEVAPASWNQKHSLKIKLGVTCLILISMIKTPNYVELTTQSDRPLPFVQHAKVSLWNNPNLINFKSRQFFCKESLERVEPYQFINDPVLAIETTDFDPNSIASGADFKCFDPNDLKSYKNGVTALLIRTDYSASDPGKPAIKNQMDANKVNDLYYSGSVTDAKIDHLTGNLKIKGSVLTDKADELSVTYKLFGNSFICKSVPSNKEMKFNCEIPVHIWANNSINLDQLIFSVNHQNKYQLVKLSKSLSNVKFLTLKPISYDFDGLAYRFWIPNINKQTVFFLNPANNFYSSPPFNAEKMQDFLLVSHKDYEPEPGSVILKISKSIVYFTRLFFILQFFALLATVMVGLAELRDMARQQTNPKIA